MLIVGLMVRINIKNNNLIEFYGTKGASQFKPFKKEIGKLVEKGSTFYYVIVDGKKRACRPEDLEMIDC